MITHEPGRCFSCKRRDHECVCPPSLPTASTSEAVAVNGYNVTRGSIGDRWTFTCHDASSAMIHLLKAADLRAKGNGSYEAHSHWCVAETEPSSPTDPITRPAHYLAGPYECREVIAELGLSFNVGAAFKYIWRAGKKGPALADLRKARECLDHEITRMERKP